MPELGLVTEEEESAKPWEKENTDATYRNLKDNLCVMHFYTISISRNIKICELENVEKGRITKLVQLRINQIYLILKRKEGRM